MDIIKQNMFQGERSLYHSEYLKIEDCIFGEGESPLKESSHIEIINSSFEWKYPLWYCEHIDCKDTVLLEMGRSGIWYTKDITMEDCLIEAPKTFRRSSNITLSRVSFLNALETLWNCQNITLQDVYVKGDYFAMNANRIQGTNLRISGNYAFDGAQNIELHHATVISKDAFWNCENVVVYDSYISGEYLGWNSHNVRFVNCTIESLQGMCYMEDVVLENCKLLNTTLAFEYSDVKADIVTSIDSIANPKKAYIKAESVKEAVLDETYIDPSQIHIVERMYEI